VAVKFVYVTDVYSDEIDTSLSYQPETSTGATTHSTDWANDAGQGRNTRQVAARSLEALSAAASRDQYATMPPVSAVSYSALVDAQYAPYAVGDLRRARRVGRPFNAPIEHGNHLINSSLCLSAIDPSLEASTSTEGRGSNSPITSKSTRAGQSEIAEDDREQGLATALLKHLADTPV
jgi:hypothetical protein